MAGRSVDSRRRAYITHRGPRQWGVMAYDTKREIWMEPIQWRRTRAEARADLEQELGPCRYAHCQEPGRHVEGAHGRLCEYHERLWHEEPLRQRPGPAGIGR